MNSGEETDTNTGYTKETVDQILNYADYLIDENCELKQEVFRLKRTLREIRDWLREEVRISESSET